MSRCLPKLVERETIDDLTGLEPEAVIIESVFESVRDGQAVGGALMWCTVEGFTWYQPFFNTAVIADTVFRDMVFRGASFRGARIVACRFERCRFEPDNMGGETTIDDCLFADCVFTACEIVCGDRANELTRTRWLGCTQERCRGFDGLF